MKKSNLKAKVLTPVSTKEMVSNEKKISETAEGFVNFTYLDSEGKKVSISRDAFANHLKDDLQKAEDDKDTADKNMKVARGVVQGVLFSIVESAFKQFDNPIEVKAVYERVCVQIESQAGISCSKSDVDNYRGSYSSRKSECGTAVTVVGNPVKVPLKTGEVVNFNKYVQHSKELARDVIDSKLIDCKDAIKTLDADIKKNSSVKLSKPLTKSERTKLAKQLDVFLDYVKQLQTAEDVKTKARMQQAELAKQGRTVIV
tara:strand:+ start:839 stop:1612 length:774 start_codon:yes stop_codon:yes gene_type:complete